MKGSERMKHPGGRPQKQIVVDSIPEQPYFTVGEVAKLTGSHVNTIRARLNDGTLQGRKLGGIWRIYRDSLIAERTAP